MTMGWAIVIMIIMLFVFPWLELNEPWRRFWDDEWIERDVSALGESFLASEVLPADEHCLLQGWARATMLTASYSPGLAIAPAVPGYRISQFSVPDNLDMPFVAAIDHTKRRVTLIGLSNVQGLKPDIPTYGGRPCGKSLRVNKTADGHHLEYRNVESAITWRDGTMMKVDVRN